jgi:hypothetical protein
LEQKQKTVDRHDADNSGFFWISGLVPNFPPTNPKIQDRINLSLAPSTVMFFYFLGNHLKLGWREEKAFDSSISLSLISESVVGMIVYHYAQIRSAAKSSFRYFRIRLASLR